MICHVTILAYNQILEIPQGANLLQALRSAGLAPNAPLRRAGSIQNCTHSLQLLLLFNRVSDISKHVHAVILEKYCKLATSLFPLQSADKNAIIKEKCEVIYGSYTTEEKDGSSPLYL